MIFDSAKELSANMSQAAPLGGKAAIGTSIDDYMQERRQRLEKRDLGDLYRTCKLTINREYFHEASPGAEHRRRRIGKARSPPREHGGRTDRALQVRSLNVVPLRAQSGKPVLESIKEMQGEHLAHPMKPTRRGRDENGARKELGAFCSLHALEPRAASLTDVEVECGRGASRAGEWDPANVSTLKSLESLDRQSFCPREPVVSLDERCSVCRKRLGLRASAAVTIRCGHAFHEACFRKWVGENCAATEERCPKCLADL